jgi:Tfp pilus assembly protein PilW
VSRRRTALRALRRDDGVTLVELLVTMAVGMIVLIAILNAADVFGSTANTATRRSVSQEELRATMRSLTDTMRQARRPATERSPLAHTDTTRDGDLVAAVYLPTPAGPRPGWVRYCRSADGRSLLTGQRLADAWADAGDPGACAPTATADQATGWVYAVTIDGGLASANPIFDFSSDACFGATPSGCRPAADDVRTVGVRLAVTRTDRPGATLALSGAVSLRNRSETTP